MKNMMCLLLILVMLGIGMGQSLPAPPSLAVVLDILEEQPAGTILTNLVTAAQLSQYYPQHSLDKLQFVLMDHSADQDFVRVDAQGNLRVEEPIDRDVLCNQDVCQVDLDFTLQPVTDFNNLLKLTLRIQDINDNAPTFGVAQVTLELGESAQQSAQLVLPAAEDADQGAFAVQEYRLVGNQDVQEIFDLRVVQNTGSSDDVSLILKQQLDRETVASYHMKVVAFDGGSKNGSLEVEVKVIDVNDNPPRFQSEMYEVSVREDVPVGSTVITMFAYDNDLGDNGHVTYSLAASTSAQLSSMFAIAPDTGAIYTLTALDHEAGAAHFLSVVARDSGSPTALAAYSKVKVIILDVNDHAPLISVQALAGEQVQVQEGAPAGTFLAQVSVHDPDSGNNGRFSCSLDSSHFSLQPLTATQFKLITTAEALFDREQIADHQLMMQCTDQGEKPRTATKYVTVHVIDRNDHDPIFSRSEYRASIAENNIPGTYITRVNASDADAELNAKIVYSLQIDQSLDSRLQDMVVIDPDTGIITASGVLDHEEQARYSFRVIAIDQGQPPRSAESRFTLDIMDINDCAPQFAFDSYTFGTFENQAERVEIGTLEAVDMDGPPYNIIRYTLDPRIPDSALFDIDPATGILTSRKVLDREVNNRYDIRVLASNEGYFLTGSSEVTIYVADKNDNAPIITYPKSDNNSVDIGTLTPVGATITQIEAFDLDLGENAQLTFSIVSGNDAGFFDIDPILGWILVAKDLSQETSQYQSVVVLVQDNGQPPLSSVSQYQFYLNDSLAVLAAKQAESDSNTTAILVICLLVFVITVIVVILFTLVMIRRRRNQRESHKYNCRVEASKVLSRPGSADSSKKEPGKVAQDNSSLQWSAAGPTVIENPQAHSTLMDNSLDRSGVSQQRKRDCSLREVQLQVHDLLHPGRAARHHDPDSDSLTDSGKGPSEEGDHQHRQPLHSDSTDDSIQPPLPPRQDRLPQRGATTSQQQQQPSSHYHDSRDRSFHVVPDMTPDTNKVQGRKQSPVKSVHFRQPHEQTFHENSQRPHLAPTVRISQQPSSPFSTVHSQQTEPYYRHPPYLYGPPSNRSHDPAGRSHDQESEEEVSDGESSTSGSFVIDHRGSEQGHYRDVIV